jgi:hypothetical protein
VANGNQLTIITDRDDNDLYVADRIEFIGAGPQMLGKDGDRKSVV